MYRGEFNINGFMRILTEGEVRTALPTPTPTSNPNPNPNFNPDPNPSS